MMEKKVIDQKEYLKKYLSSGNGDEKKKKKKRKLKVGAQTVKIIDDDIDLKNMRPVEENEFELFLNAEDAPQIAGVVDERGPVDFTDKRKWKIIADDEGGDLTITTTGRGTKQFKQAKNISGNDSSPNRESQKYSDSDLSPVRLPKEKKNGANREAKVDDDSDLSPPRMKSKRYVNSEDDHSHSDNSSQQIVQKKTRRKKEASDDSDLSPPRKRRSREPEKISKHRQYKDRNYEPDFSSPRHSRKHRDSYFDSRRDRHSDPNSLKRHKHRDERNRDRIYSEKDSRSEKRYFDTNGSSNRYRGDGRDSSKSRGNKYNDWQDRDAKYSHREESHINGKKSKHREDADEDIHEKRMKKTLDGKKAGLQDARALREETEVYRKREAEQFSKLSKEVTGVGQAAIVRDTKTGRKRNLEAEEAEEREKQKRQAELDEKYAKWGKGLKQVEDRDEKLKDDLYEMSKPLARYADDVDLDKRLREQEREGDPMLEYIKQKQIKEGKRKPDRPKYEGSHMPNRFGIKPGHRWDGVDRSNGYEKRWFEAQNAKIALQEEAYKWSTSDM